ncbi:MAG: hypothetical protein KKA73_05630 [Chloroflexi bacterium]|nr:hypothetical protein [Chloroflexota bacterium]MBU1747148.1 hypothetical protein [Chloroflexota bacterium]
MTDHLYLCPACGRSFTLTNSDQIPDHASGRGCSYQGSGQRLTFTGAEAAQGIDVAVLRTRATTGDAAAQPGREAGQPPFTVAHVQLAEPAALPHRCPQCGGSDVEPADDGELWRPYRCRGCGYVTSESGFMATLADLLNFWATVDVEA